MYLNYPNFRWFTVLIAVFLTFLYTLYEGWYSYLILWVLGIVFAFVFLSLKHKTENKVLFSIFIFTYGFYSIYMYITNFLYVKNPETDFFMMVDSMKFWTNSNFKLNSLSDVWDKFNTVETAVLRYKLFNFISIFTAYLSQLTDENNILVQKLQSVFLGAFSMPYIYLMLKKYFEKQKAYVYTLFFAVFSFVCIYSVVFNRDPHVYFLYTLGSYLIVYHKEKKFVFLKLLFIMILLIGFRIEHALFFVTFLVTYVYLVTKKNRTLILIGGGLVTIVFAILLPLLIAKYDENTEAYENQTGRVERKEISFGAAFSNLPPGIKQSLMMINGQIAPAVPFWRGWFLEGSNTVNMKHTEDGYYTPWRFMESIAAVVWIYIWGFLIYGFYRKWYKIVPVELLILFGIAILLLLLSSSSINTRRIYCVFPVMFVVAMIFYEKMDIIVRKKIINWISLFFIAIYSAYFAIKGGF